MKRLHEFTYKLFVSTVIFAITIVIMDGIM